MTRNKISRAIAVTAGLVSALSLLTPPIAAFAEQQPYEPALTQEEVAAIAPESVDDVEPLSDSASLSSDYCADDGDGVSLLASDATIRDVADLLADAIYNLDTELDISSYNLTRADTQRAYDIVSAEHPEYFYMPAVYPIGTTGDQIGYFTFFYYEGVENIPAMRERYELAVDAALSWTSPTWSDIENAKALNDYLVWETCYGYPSSGDKTVSHGSYGCLVNKRAVCDGYAKAYRDLCSRVGIKCAVTKSKELNHAWNIVTIGKHNYHVDVCWNDPILGANIGDYDDVMGKTMMRYFLYSDAGFKANGHRGWATSLRCDDATYDGREWQVYTGPVGATYGFSDVGASDWYVTSGILKYVIDNGIMHGYDSSLFGPNDSLTRAQFAAILYNRVGGDYPSNRNETGMSDVKANQWYTAAANWAVDTGAIGGYANADGSRSFAPDAPITRQEIVTILCNIAGGKLEGDGSDAKLSDYDDEDAVAGWAKDAMAQGVASGLIQGSGGKLRPSDRCSRVEGATFVVRAITELGII